MTDRARLVFGVIVAVLRDRRARDDLTFLLLNAVPMRMRGRLYLWVCRRQMEKWHGKEYDRG